MQHEIHRSCSAALAETTIVAGASVKSAQPWCWGVGVSERVQVKDVSMLHCAHWGVP
jgi:hypothetical protein